LVDVSSQPPSSTEATTTNHNDAFEKVKAIISRINVAPTATVSQLVDVAVQDSHGTSIVSKREGKEMVSI